MMATSMRPTASSAASPSVERRDSESFETFKRDGLFAATDFHAGNAPLHQPPSLVRTWYDVGAYDPTGALAKAQRLQFFQGDPDAAPILGNRLDPAIWDYSRPLLRQAQSASKGRIIREEIYGEDGSALAAVPYKVTQNRLYVRLLQPTANNVFASFLVADCETIVYDYEREASDPQVSHSFGAGDRWLRHRRSRLRRELSKAPSGRYPQRREPGTRAGARAGCAARDRYADRRHQRHRRDAVDRPSLPRNRPLN